MGFYIYHNPVKYIVFVDQRKYQDSIKQKYVELQKYKDSMNTVRIYLGPGDDWNPRITHIVYDIF